MNHPTTQRLVLLSYNTTPPNPPNTARKRLQKRLLYYLLAILAIGVFGGILIFIPCETCDTQFGRTSLGIACMVLSALGLLVVCVDVVCSVYFQCLLAARRNRGARRPTILRSFELCEDGGVGDVERGSSVQSTTTQATALTQPELEPMNQGDEGQETSGEGPTQQSSLPLQPKDLQEPMNRPNWEVVAEIRREQAQGDGVLKPNEERHSPLPLSQMRASERPAEHYEEDGDWEVINF